MIFFRQHIRLKNIFIKNNFLKCRYFGDLSAISEIGRDVKKDGMMEKWPRIYRKALVEQIISEINSSHGNFVLVAGPTGAGKKTLFKHVIASDITTSNIIEIDFNKMKKFNFEVMVEEFFQQANTCLSAFVSSGDVLTAVLNDSFLQNFRTLLEAKNNSKIGIGSPFVHSKLMSLSGKMNHQNWDNAMQYLISDQVSTIVRPLTPSNIALWVVQAVDSFKRPLPFDRLNNFMTFLNKISQNNEKKISFMISGAEVLWRSPQFREEGPRFVDFLTQSIKNHNITNIMSSSDSMVTLKYGPNPKSEKNISKITVSNNNVTVEIAKNIITADQYIHVGEWSKELTIKILSQVGYADKKVTECIWKCVGGNAKLIKCVVECLRDSDKAADKTTSSFREKEADYHSRLEPGQEGVVRHFEPEENELMALTATEQYITRRLRFQQSCIEHLPKRALAKEMLIFEWKMTKVLSHPLMEKARNVLENKVHFYVSFCESVRCLIDHPTLLINNILETDHPVIIALLDANILVPCYSPRRLEFQSTLCRHLLLSFLEYKFQSLTFWEQIQYNVNLLMQKKEIESRIAEVMDRV
eukprot:GHVL01032107.1.p1 GENE.GHVL01032107.1~~GHVL01032107.1.p1  ORF type:complete len:583 (+),score=101.93 GHVL01032107.1:1393-3141(+)